MKKILRKGKYGQIEIYKYACWVEYESLFEMAIKKMETKKK